MYIYEIYIDIHIYIGPKAWARSPSPSQRGPGHRLHQSTSTYISFQVHKTHILEINFIFSNQINNFME